MKARILLTTTCFFLFYVFFCLSLTEASPAKVYKGFNIGDENAVWVLEQFDKTSDPPGSLAWLPNANVKT
ncbi:MAG TPA: hypothetical protein VN631_18765 [Negativicutes bacterium]|nr:hypothetical protein [Negativicutes bacterium]